MDFPVFVELKQSSNYKWLQADIVHCFVQQGEAVALVSAW